MTKTTGSLRGIDEEIKDVLTEIYTDKGFEIRRVEMVGPKVGKDLRQQGLWAIIFAMVGILLYAWWRFEFVFSIGAILALAHDTVITIGAISLTNREFSLSVVAALLTIVGYSINDTIVVYDRVRENIRLSRGNSMFDTLNMSINETLGRTFLTTFTTFMVVICLFLFGGQVINDFAFALVVGVIVGTYSSAFIASPIVLLIHNWEKARTHRAAVSEKSRMAAHTGSKVTTSKIAAMDKQSSRQKSSSK
jgi:preprotein translocase subunit SecF